jgi:hypothetical protein
MRLVLVDIIWWVVRRGYMDDERQAFQEARKSANMDKERATRLRSGFQYDPKAMEYQTYLVLGSAARDRTGCPLLCI